MYLFLAVLDLPRCVWAFSKLQQAQGYSLVCRVQASHCGDFSGYRVRALGHLVSVAVAPMLSCGILPDQGSNLRSLHCQVGSEPLNHQASPWLNNF